MHLTGEAIKKFQKIYKNMFGIELSKEEALEKGNSVLMLVQLTHKPINKLNKN